MGQTIISPPVTGQSTAWSATNPLGQKYWTNYCTFNAPTNTGSLSNAVNTRIQYSNGYYFFGDTNGWVWYSTDAKTWNAVQPNTTYSITGIAYNGTIWVVVYSNNTIYTASTPSGTWTARTSQITGTSGIQDVRWIPQLSLFIACGTPSAAPWNVIESSPDGITWTSRYSNPAANTTLYSMIALDDTTATPTIAIGSNNANTASVVYSTNGTSWTGTNANNSNAASSIQFIKGALSRFVAVNSGGGFYAQTSAAIGTAWNTTPYVTARMMFYSQPFTNGTLNNYSVGELQYDSVNNLYYMLALYNNGSGIVNLPTLFTLDASKLVTPYLITGTQTNFSFPIIKTEYLPSISFGQTTNNYGSAGYGYVNGIHIWATNDNGYNRQIYTTA